MQHKTTHGKFAEVRGHCDPRRSAILFVGLDKVVSDFSVRGWSKNPSLFAAFQVARTFYSNFNSGIKIIDRFWSKINANVATLNPKYSILLKYFSLWRNINSKGIGLLMNSEFKSHGHKLFQGFNRYSKF